MKVAKISKPAGNENRTRIHSLEGCCLTIGRYPHLAGTTELESATSGVTDQRSNQLSYAPIYIDIISYLIFSCQETFQSFIRLIKEHFAGLFSLPKEFSLFAGSYLCFI